MSWITAAEVELKALIIKVLEELDLYHAPTGTLTTPSPDVSLPNPPPAPPLGPSGPPPETGEPIPTVPPAPPKGSGPV